jgi:ankyrin repeat protein
MLARLLVLLLIPAMTSCRFPSSHPAYKLFANVKEGNVEALRSALRDGVSPDLYSSEYGYLIIAAVYAPDTKILSLLIGAGADVNVSDPESGITPLIASVTANRCEAARVLLGAHANTKATYAHAGVDANGDLNGMTVGQIYTKLGPSLEKASSCWKEVRPSLLAQPSG